jgi:hypothetical protein
MLEHCVKDNQQLAHAGGKRDLRWFAVTEQPLIEGAEHWVTTAPRQRCHIEYIPYVTATAPNHALAAPRTTIAIKRCHADQGGNLPPIKRAEFRQMGEQVQAQYLANAWYRAQQVFLLAPQGRIANGLVELAVKSAHAFFEPTDMRRDFLSQRFAVSALNESPRKQSSAIPCLI